MQCILFMRSLKVLKNGFTNTTLFSKWIFPFHDRPYRFTHFVHFVIVAVVFRIVFTFIANWLIDFILLLLLLLWLLFSVHSTSVMACGLHRRMIFDDYWLLSCRGWYLCERFIMFPLANDDEASTNSGWRTLFALTILSFGWMWAKKQKNNILVKRLMKLSWVFIIRCSVLAHLIFFFCSFLLPNNFCVWFIEQTFATFEWLQTIDRSIEIMTEIFAFSRFWNNFQW